MAAVLLIIKTRPKKSINGEKKSPRMTMEERLKFSRKEEKKKKRRRNRRREQ